MSASFFYNVLKDIIRASKWGTEKNTRILEARRKWEPQFGEEVYRCWEESLRKDVVVVDIRYLATYSDQRRGGTKKGISEWFKVGLVQARSDEFALMLSMVHVKPLEDGWARAEYDDPDPNVIKAYVVAFVKYERVVDVRWGGDKYTNLPVIYCQFNGRRKGTPYDRVTLCTEGGDERFPPHYFEFSNADELYRNGVIPEELLGSRS